MFGIEILEMMFRTIIRRFRLLMLTFDQSTSMTFYSSPALFLNIRRTFAAAILVFGIIAIFSLNGTAQSNPDPQDAVAVFNAAQDLHEKGKLAEALRLYEEAIRIEPQFAEAEYQRGIAQLSLGKSLDAERSFRRAVELRPAWTLAMASLGSLLVQQNKVEEAEQILVRVLSSDSLNPPALTALADLYLKTGAPAKSLQDLLTNIAVLTGKASPTPSLWTAQAALENVLGRRTQAKQSIANALLIDGSNSSALLLAGNIAIVEGDIVRAKEILTRLTGNSSDPASVVYLRANVFAFEGNYDEAIAELNSIKANNKDAADLLSRIRTARSTSPAELEKALAVNTSDSVVLGRLCTLYRKDDPTKALEYCRRASEAEPENINHAVGFGAALVQAKQFEAAVGLLKKIIEIVPDNATAHANLGTALFQLKRYAEANTEFEWLTKAQPKSPGAYLFLGIAHDQLSHYLDAMANYQQYLRLADPVENKLDIEKVNLRLPSLQKLIKDGKGKKNE